MRLAKPSFVFLLIGFLVAVAIAPARAVILYGTATRNTTAPTGALANSGWQYQGQWNGFLGTPIAPHYFIAARHVGGTVGDKFLLAGNAYTTVAVTSSPNTDVNIWQVTETFPIFAPLYDTSDETGQPMVVFGRGTQRGGAVVDSRKVRGWQWGAFDQVQSWGTNVVSAVVDGGASLGSLLEFNFDSSGGVNEGCLSAGDSSGGVFIQVGGVWKLAGLNYGVDGPWSYYGGSDPGFSASIFDARGLYVGGPGAYQFISRKIPQQVPAGSYATRISTNLTFIHSVIGTP